MDMDGQVIEANMGCCFHMKTIKIGRRFIKQIIAKRQQAKEGNADLEGNPKTAMPIVQRNSYGNNKEEPEGMPGWMSDWYFWLHKYLLQIN